MKIRLPEKIKKSSKNPKIKQNFDLFLFFTCFRTSRTKSFFLNILLKFCNAQGIFLHSSLHENERDLYLVWILQT
jgi:hypothetical protein